MSDEDRRIAAKKPRKPLKVSGLVSVLVQGDLTVLAIETPDGRREIEMTADVAAEIAHIIADALLAARSEPEVPAQLLLPGRPEPVRLETVRGRLGAEEKFVVAVGSPGATKMTFRLSPESARSWLETMKTQLERRNRH